MPFIKQATGRVKKVKSLSWLGANAIAERAELTFCAITALSTRYTTP
ncbi:hypothetical protein H6F76_23895 [Leptolyngbya sp. FACHB-321]|nr:hypothetical protein [Leptolyngbya sp. FACHB-321]MBD2037997.1 hypothetical protein [Leptolyngbya sp. FACHB-321]